MAFISGSIPPIRCFVLPEYLQNLDGGWGEDFLPCVIYGVDCTHKRAIGFRMMLQNGVSFRNLPANAFRLVPKGTDRGIRNHQLCTWDCPSSTFGVNEFDMLKNGHCRVRLRDTSGRSCKKWENSRYLFTITFSRVSQEEACHTHADDPDAKDMHIIATNTGYLCAVPNNCVLWHDLDWVTRPADTDSIPRYRAWQHLDSVEAQAAYVGSFVDPESEDDLVYDFGSDIND